MNWAGTRKPTRLLRRRPRSIPRAGPIRRQGWDVVSARGGSRPDLLQVFDELGDTPFYEPTRMPGLD